MRPRHTSYSWSSLLRRAAPNRCDRTGKNLPLRLNSRNSKHILHPGMILVRRLNWNSHDDHCRHIFLHYLADRPDKCRKYKRCYRKGRLKSSLILLAVRRNSIRYGTLGILSSNVSYHWIRSTCIHRLGTTLGRRQSLHSQGRRYSRMSLRYLGDHPGKFQRRNIHYHTNC